MDLKQALAERLADAAALPSGEILEKLEIPPDPQMGDIAFPCFILAKAMRKSPAAIALELAEKLAKPDFIERMEAAGPYLNFTYRQPVLIRHVMDKVRGQEQYGSRNQGRGKTVCLDYSSVNIAKPFHVGHLLTTAIGNSLRHIYSFLGYRCVGINHLGDWGTQFGKLIVAYQKWGDREQIEANPLHALEAIYVRFHQEAEQDETLEDQAREWFKRIEDHDPEAMQLFEWFKELTMREVQRVYDELGVSFDSFAGESFYIDKMEGVVGELREKGLLIESEGAYVVDLEQYQMPPCLILKQDGASLYATRDIAAALYRKQTYDFDQCLYVVASHQSLHFAQVFKVIELMGRPWYGQLEHVSYGMVSLEDGAMATRKGRVVRLEELLSRAVEKAENIIREKSPDLAEYKEAAHQVGVGAVLFSALFNGRMKDMVFSWDRALNFDGETGPYVQYTHARCCSVLRKAEISLEGEADWEAIANRQSVDITLHLDRFPDVVQEAAQRNEPYLVTRYVVELAQLLNRYYYHHRILEGEPAVQRAGLQMVQAVRRVLATGLSLIGVQAPERM